jgi:3-oxoacyl-[acyl-carrier protein] reductase
VTGGASGLGWAICERLAAEGWRVVVADVDSDLMRQREAEGPGPICHYMDVRRRDEVEAVFGRTAAELGGLDLVVNSAGVHSHAPTEQLAWDDWRKVMDVNLDGVFNCLQSAGRIMLRAGSGCIVSMASVAAERGARDRAAYCAAKAGVVALTRVAAVEWAARGVRVNAIGPGYVDTPMFRHAVEGGVVHEPDILARIPARRLGSAEEVAAVVSFLASPGAAYITGQVLWVDGGFLADYGVGTHGTD